MSLQLYGNTMFNNIPLPFNFLFLGNFYSVYLFRTSHCRPLLEPSKASCSFGSSITSLRTCSARLSKSRYKRVSQSVYQCQPLKSAGMAKGPPEQRTFRKSTLRVSSWLYPQILGFTLLRYGINYGNKQFYSISSSYVLSC